MASSGHSLAGIATVEKIAESLLESPEKFLSPDAGLATLMERLLKILYEMGQESHPRGFDASGLSELALEGFDSEQIWEMMQLHVTPLLAYVEGKATTLAKRGVRPSAFFPVDKEGNLLEVDPKKTRRGRGKSALDAEEGGEEEKEEETQAEDGEDEDESDEDMGDEDDEMNPMADLDPDVSDSEIPEEDKLEFMGGSKKKKSRDITSMLEEGLDEDDEEGEITNEQFFGKAYVDGDDPALDSLRDKREKEFQERTKRRHDYLRSRDPHNPAASIEDGFFNLASMEKFVRQAEEEAGEDPDFEQEEGEEDEDVDADDDAVDLGIRRRGGDSDSDSDEDDEEDEDEFEFLEKGDEEGRGKGKGRKNQKSKRSQEEDEEEDDEDDEEIDYFNELEDDDDEEEGKTRPEDMRYEDFFGAADDIQDDEEEIVDLEDDKPREAEEDKPAPGPADTKYKRAQQKIKEQIEQLEDANVGTKPWALMGEVDAEKRPENSLLDAVLSYETSSKPLPVVTQEVTQKLEDIIRHRIANKVYDDPQRKILREEPEAKKNSLPQISTEKSKESLSELYEQQFAKKAYGLELVDSVKTEAHSKIASLWANLSHKLDALSNFFFTPKPVVVEVQARQNVPSISMEEAVPTAVSDSSLVAASEIFTVQKHFRNNEAAPQLAEKRPEGVAEDKLERFVEEERSKGLVQNKRKKTAEEQAEDAAAKTGGKRFRMKEFFSEMEDRRQSGDLNRKKKGSKKEERAAASSKSSKRASSNSVKL